ncbi:MAG TPA: aminomethyl-transferring glycine dehydrogenase, partial [Candidatus Limnocylindrales bacterium]
MTTVHTAATPELHVLHPSHFAYRHIGPRRSDANEMLAVLGYDSIEAFIDAVVPEEIRLRRPLALPPGRSEREVLQALRGLAGMNRVFRSYIGMGYAGCFTPQVVQRNVMENPGWYTAYTPYQAEISQGRLEALLNYQTVVSDLTGLEIANASLLDEATAAAEAMALTLAVSKSSGDPVYLVDEYCHPQTIAVVQTRAEARGIRVVVGEPETFTFEPGVIGALVQYPATDGAVRDFRSLADRAHAAGALVTAATDLLALTLLVPPGEWGADIAVGNSQRFGVPMGYGGPHAAFFATRETYKRFMPGRIIGVSRDRDGRPALRMALQTREQHIRRDKATSNVCTAQVLLAVMASMYAVYHGPAGLRAIAERVHGAAARLAAGLRAGGVSVEHEHFFDTVTAVVPGRAADVVAAAEKLGVNLRLTDTDRVGISCDETTTLADVSKVWAAFGVAAVSDVDTSIFLARQSGYLNHPVFHSHHSETAMLRYLRRLSDLDYALDRGMIPLGSCTMKLNATTEMEPVTWPEFANMHPFAPAHQTTGYESLIAQLEAWLAELTGYDAVSVQPNAGSQGELAGLLAIRGYHLANGDDQRDVCLIPSSAHGTNAASAVMAGMRVVVVACDDTGNVDLVDLDTKISSVGDRLAAIMVTYPSTHGVYETGIAALCAKVHDAGGQVYVDGANLNALVGFAKPGKFGADVSHLNLHKTFCIPHGGGGPGVGPVAVRSHLTPHLSPHISAAPHGSAGILPISWSYVRMMGPDGLAAATATAVLAANYVAARLREHYPVLYTGNKGLVAHECILDLRQITKETGVSVDDVAKRLIDYGFHAPTMSFPVAGTLMVEPTESEDLGELDRFI